MILTTTGTGTNEDPYRADESQIPEEIREYVEATEQVSATEWLVIFSDKYEKQLLKEETERLKAENKLLKDRIAGATDFNDLKAKIVKVKDSEDNPTKWSDKVFLLEGEKIEHKGLFYISLSDHTADKAKEPQNAPELYRPA